MERRSAWSLALACLLGAWAAWAQSGKELVGKYAMEVDPQEVLELRADGSASMGGEPTTWSVKGNHLTVGPDTMVFQLEAGRLLLQMGSVQLAWKKVGAPGKGPTPAEKAAAKARAKQEQADDDAADREAMAQAQAWMAQQGQAQPPPQRGQRPAQPAQPPAGGAAQDQQLAQLLMSSAWCSFTYNQRTGTSATSRVVFSADGTVSLNGNTETYNTGPNGTVAGQYGDQGAARWRVQGQRLLLDQGAGFQDVGLTGTRNSNGSPILKADGREYSMCR